MLTQRQNFLPPTEQLGPPLTRQGRRYHSGHGTQHRDILQLLDARRKVALKGAKTKLPTSIRIPVGHTPYGMNTAVATPPPRRRKQWSDVLRHTTPDTSGVTQEIQLLNKIPVTHSPQQPTMNPLDAMEKLLSDLRLHGPVFEGAVHGQVFDVVGGFKNADCSVMNFVLRNSIWQYSS